MTKYTAGRGLGILLLIAGSAHVLAPAGFDAIIPPILPFDAAMTVVLAGVSVGDQLVPPVRLESVCVRLM